MDRLNVDSNFGHLQVADSIENHIHAMPCPGPHACPVSRQSESTCQAEFYRDTGIWAPAAAREELEKLMQKHGFTAHALKKAWQSGSLLWSDEQQRLVTKTHVLEPVFGYAIAAIMVVYLLFQCAAWIINPPKGTWPQLAEFISAGSLYAVMLYLAARFLVAPHAIATKIERIVNPDKAMANAGR